MKHILPHPILSENQKTLVSPSYSPITTYFETDQGSKYLLSQKGESKRWKSPHAMSVGDDTGLKPWFSKCAFVPNEDFYPMSAYESLEDKGFECSLSKAQNGKVTWIVNDKGRARPALFRDAYPTWAKSNPKEAEKPLEFTLSMVPIKKYNVVEWDEKPNGVVKRFHPGSPVSKILPIRQADPRDLAYFGIR